MEKFKSRDFDIEVSHGGISIVDPYVQGRFSFSAGEGGLVREFLGQVWRLTGLPTLPEQMSNPSDSIEVVSRPDDLLELRRVGAPEYHVGLCFKVEECDWVIDAVDAGVSKFKDVFSLSPQPRGTGQYAYNGPNDGTDIIEGR